MVQNAPFRTKLTAAIALPNIGAAMVAMATLVLGGSMALAIMAILLVFGVAVGTAILHRQLVARLDELATAADDLATVRLPQLIVARATDDDLEPTPIPGETDEDEIGRLVKALNRVEATAAGAADEQREAVRIGLGRLVVNLARRNQSLLDRQIAHIDHLEAEEEDPDRLQELYGVDHLATRMRRNADSLLVLADEEPPRRRGKPIEMIELIRVALSEIEDYNNVQIGNIHRADIGIHSAIDLAHLVSELLENATQFSPPENDVEVRGTSQVDGGYLLSIVDHGIGMSREQLDANNELLREPPELDLQLSHSLGFMVIGRLAKRLGLEVELSHTGGGGLTAQVLLPTRLLDGSSSDSGSDGEAEEEAETDVNRWVAAIPEAPATPAVEPTPEPAAEIEIEAAVELEVEVGVGVEVEVQAEPEVGVEVDAEAESELQIPADRDAVPGRPKVEPRSLTGISFDLPETSGWTPTAIPERGSNELGRRDGGPDIGPTEPKVADAAAPDPLLSIQSEALAKLLGQPVSETEPEAPQAETAEPETPKATTAEPKTAEPKTAEPKTVEPENAEPETTESTHTEQPVARSRAKARSMRKQPLHRDAPTAPGFTISSKSTEADAPATDKKTAQPEKATAKPSTPKAGNKQAPRKKVGRRPAAKKTTGKSAARKAPAGKPAVDKAAAEKAAAAKAAAEKAAADKVAAEEAAAAKAAAEAPTSLDEAVPSGEQFEAGVNALLDDAIPNPVLPQRGTGQLTKRDRSQSQAPESEGRAIPAAQATQSATASNRKPEEVRQMLADYRKGRKRPTGPADEQASDANPKTTNSSGGPA